MLAARAFPLEPGRQRRGEAVPAREPSLEPIDLIHDLAVDQLAVGVEDEPEHDRHQPTMAKLVSNPWLCQPSLNAGSTSFQVL
jgi:hypothetical protein